MRIAQERTPAGCAWALAAGWMAWAVVLRRVDPFDYLFVGLLVGLGVFLLAYRKIYPDAILIAGELPQPGATFRGKVETPLKSEPASPRVRLVVVRQRGRNRKALWQSEIDGHPMRGEHGIVFPFEIAVPADVAALLDPLCQWRLVVTAGLYRAAFKLSQTAIAA